MAREQLQQPGQETQAQRGVVVNHAGQGTQRFISDAPNPPEHIFIHQMKMDEAKWKSSMCNCSKNC